METKTSKTSKETKDSDHSRIELRSEKVRHLIGEIPPALVRWGIALIVLLFALLLAVVLCVKYPYGHGETILQHVMG